MTPTGVWLALREVYDPCSQAWARPLSLVDLGLVRDVSVEGGSVRVRIGLTVPYCLAVATIMRAVEQRVGELDGVSEVLVDIDQDATWSPELMTDHGRRSLAAHRTRDSAAHRLRGAPPSGWDS
jgi:metal-sulfur cluster biosynthetic enzyme